MTLWNTVEMTKTLSVQKLDFYIKVIFIVAICALSTTANARIPRSQTARHEFVRQQACPATGVHRLPCPGWQIDHVMPLKCKGPDTPANMQWLTVDDHKAKTRREAGWCRANP